MDCKSCGTPNPDDAVFCKKCGSRLDGMRTCPACGKLTPSEGDFCIYCGASKSAQPPAPVAARHKPAVGPGAEVAATTAGTEVLTPPVAEAEGVYALEKYRPMLKKVSALFAALTALVGIIFVFLLEFTVTMSYEGYTQKESSNIFYFFGDAWNAITSDYNTYAQNAMTAGTAFGTVCCAVAIVITVVCFIVAALRSYKVFSGKTDKGLIVPCAATFISFVCGAALFLLATYTYCNIDYEGMDIQTSLGGAAVAGIVLGAIFLAIAVLAEFAANIRVGGLPKYVPHCLLAAVTLIFGFVAVSAMADGGISVEFDAGYNYCGSMLFGQYTVFSVLAIFAPDERDTVFFKMYNTEVALTVVLVVAAVLFCVFFIAALSKMLGCKGEEISSKALTCAILAGICAIICGAMMIASSQTVVEWVADLDWEGGIDFTSSLTVPIVMIVFGALMAIAAAAYKFRGKIKSLQIN